MSDFDLDSYLAKRYQNIGDDKLSELAAASQVKINALGKYAEKIEVAKAASKQRNTGSVLGILQDMTGTDDSGVMGHDGALGMPINATVALGSGFSKLSGYVASGANDLDAMYNNSRIPQEVKDARARQLQGAATPEDEQLLALPSGELQKRAEHVTGDWQHVLRKDFKSNLSQIQDMETAVSRSETLRNFFDLSGAVHTGNKDDLTGDLRESAADNIATFSQGVDQLKAGKLSGLGDVALGFGGAVAKIPGAALSNPLGAADFLAENGAQLLASGAGKIPQILANVGYGLDAFGQGVVDHVRKNKGAMPTNEDLAWKAALAGTAVAAEYAGDKLSGVTDLFKPVGKVAGAEAKAAMKKALGYADNVVTRTASASVKGGAGEFGTEGYQTWAENAIKLEDTSLADAFEGGAIGAIIGGGTGVAAHLGKELTGTTDGKLEKAVASRKQRADFDALAQTNDTTALLDPEAKGYDPVKAVAVLAEHAKLEDTTPEVRAANLTKAREVVQSLAESHDRNLALLDTLSDKAELQLAKEELVAKKAELAAADPANDALVAPLRKQIAFREQIVALEGDTVALKRLSGEVKRSELQLKAAKEVQETLADRVRTNVSVEAVTAHVKAANRTQSADNMPDMEDSRHSVQALLNLSMVSPTQLSVDSANELASNKHNTLTAEERDYFRQFSEARVAENKLMSLGKVSQSVFTGTNKDIGIVGYRKTLGQAFEAKDKATVHRSLEALLAFADSHLEKAQVASALFAKVRHSGDKQVLRVKGGGWEVVPAGKPLSLSVIKANGGFTIHTNSGEYVSDVATEAVALSQAVKEQKAAYVVTFGKPYVGQSPSVAASTPSVAPTTAAPSSATPVVSAEPKSVKVESVQSAASPTAPTKEVSVTKQAEGEPRPKQDTVVASKNDNTQEAQKAEENQQHSVKAESGSEAAAVVQPGPSASISATESEPTDRDKVLLADLVTKVTDRKLRHLVDAESSKLKAVLDTLAPYFKDQINRAAFFVHSGVKAPASAFTGAPVIFMQAYLFTAAELVDKTEEFRLRYILAHELAHLKDQDTGYASGDAQEIQRGGEVYNELQQGLTNTAYPFIREMFTYVLVKPKVTVDVSAEIYAQLAAVYAINPQLLKAALPNGYKYIEAQFANTQSVGTEQVATNPTEEAGTDVPRTRSVSEHGENAGSSGTEATQTGGLVALEGTKSAPGTAYQDRNLLVDHFTQSVAGVTAASQRPLVMVKDFIQSVTAGTTKFADFLKDYKATEKQEAALAFFAEKNAEWSSAIQKLLVHGYYTKGVHKEDRAHFYQNPFNWMIQKDDKGVYSIEGNTNTSLVYAAFSTLLELADASPSNNDKTINAILGRSDEAEVPALAYKTLGSVGTLANLLRNSTGKTAVAALGLKTDSDAGQNLLPQLEGGMGGLVEAFLLNLGLVEEKRVTPAELNAVLDLTNQIDGSPEGTGYAPAKEDRVFIGIARDPQTGELTQKVKDILESMKGSSNVLDKLFSVETQMQYPSFTPIENTQTSTKTGQQVPRLLSETNDQNRNQANYARQDMWKLLQSVSGDIVGAMAGIEEISETATQNTKRRSIKAKNDGLWRELNRYDDYMKDVLLASSEGINQPIYLDYSVWLQQRVGISTNVINPQTSKAHRALFFRGSWESEVELTNAVMMDNFFMRVGEGFGVKTERDTVEASLTKIQDKLADPVVKQAITALQTVINTDNGMSAAEQQNLLAAVKLGGENFHTLDALVAMAHYQQALDSDAGSFVTHIQAEVDGVANGPILAHALFGAAPSSEALLKTLERGGLYSEQSGQDAFNIWKSNPLNHDLYEHTITRVIQGIAKAVSGNWKEENANAVFFFTGMLTKDDGNISSDGRNIIKGPVTEMVFGSGIPKSLNHMAELFIGKVYDVMEKSANGDEKYPAKEVIKNFNRMMGNKNRGMWLSLDDVTRFNTEFFLNAAETRAIKQAFGYVFNKPVQETIEANFADFISRRDAFTQVAELTHGLYATVYDTMRQQLIDKLVADEIAQPGTGIPSTYETNKVTKVKRVIPLRDLSKTEERQLEKQLAKMFPVVQTMFSLESKQPKAGLRIGKTTKKVSGAKAYETKVNQRTGERDSTATTVRSMETVQEKPGVAMLPLLIHSTDSYISHSTQMGMELLNIHDAVIAGLMTIHEAAEKMNQQTFHALLNYSPMLQMYYALENTVNGLDQVMVADESGTVAKEINWYLQQFASEKELGQDNTLLEMLKLAKEAAVKSDTIKLNALKDIAYVNQYARENASYEVTPEQKAAIAEKLEAINADIDSKTLRSVNTIFEQLPGQNVAPQRAAKKATQVDDMPDLVEPTQTYSTHDIYNALTSTVSPTFDVRLRNLLTNIVEKLHGPFGSFKASLMGETTKSALDVYAEALATDQAPFVFSLHTAGFTFSDQQMYVAEQVHASILAALDSKDGRNTVVYTELGKLYRETRERLKDTAWATDAATAPLYNRLFNELPTDPAARDNYLAEFAALGLAHEEFNKLLQVPTKMAPKVMLDKTIGGMLTRLFNQVLEFLNGKLSNTVAGQNADQKLKGLVQKLIDIEDKRKRVLAAPQGEFLKFVDKQAMTVRMGKKSLVSKLAHSNMFMKNKNVFIASASGVVATLADSQVGLFFKNVDAIRQEHFSGIPGITSGFLAEMNGPKPVIQGLLRAVKHFEGQRKKIITMTNKFVLQAFDNQGKDLEDFDKRAITKVMLHTGAHVLLDQAGYDTNKLEALLKDPAALKAEIAVFEAKLGTFTPAQQAFFVEQSRALGFYLVTGKVTVELMHKNANNIARMYLTDQQGVLTEAEIADATKIVDALTSLNALAYTNDMDKASMVKTLAQEHARTDGGNGVRLVLLSHKEMEQQSKDRLFSSSQSLMVKGYVPEIYNPHTNVKAANAIEGRMLEDLGYVKGAMVGNDPSDITEGTKHLYTLRDGGSLPWLSGIFSFTGMRAKGTKHHGKHAYRKQQGVTQQKLAAMQARGASRSGKNFDPTKVKQNHMAPLMNDKGQAVNYTYMMQSETKDSLLERDTRFDSVMGSLNGSIYDKENSAVHNRKAVELFHKEFEAGYNKEPKAYLTVSATSQDAELREIYQMLPQATKDAIREVWGKDEMLVRSNNLDIAFGYRKLSLSNMFDKEEEDRNFAEQTAIWWTEATLQLIAKSFLKVDGQRMTDEQAERYAKRAAVFVRRGENVWQAIVKETKDIFVIKSGITAVANIVSNMTLLKLYGVSNVSAMRDMRIAWVGAQNYSRDTERLFTLETQLAAKSVTTGLSDIKQEIRELKDAIERNPVRTLIDAGLMPTIVEDVSEDEDLYAYKTQFIRKTEKYTNKLNKQVKMAGKQLYMAHDTQMYKSMSQLTQLSDFVARYALYQHLTTRKDNPIESKFAIQEASDAFVNYDIPMHRGLQYMDDMGIMMFTKYFVRIQRVIRGRFKHAPGKVALLLLAQGYFDSLPSTLDASIVFKFGNNPFSWGALEFPSSLDELMTAKAGMSLFK